jgi:hypothetical protein
VSHWSPAGPLFCKVIFMSVFSSVENSGVPVLLMGFSERVNSLKWFEELCIGRHYIYLPFFEV